MTDQLLALAVGAVPPGTTLSSGTIRGPVHLDQLAEELGGVWFFIDHPGPIAPGAKTVIAPGAKTVIAAIDQPTLDAVLAAYTFDPYYGLPNAKVLAALVPLAENVLAGTAAFTPAQLETIAAHLIIHLAREVGS